MARTTLSEFPAHSWRTHPDDHGILYTSHIGVFKTAATKDPFCRAIILELSEEEKNQARASIEKTQDAIRHLSNAEVTCKDGTFYLKPISGFKPSIPKPLNNKDIPQPVRDMNNLMRELTRNSPLTTEFGLNVRIEDLGDDSHYHEHDFCVYNRVFFSGGTVIKTNTGYIQVNEGDSVFMKPLVEHAPETLTADNNNSKRLTIATYPSPKIDITQSVL